MNSTADRQCQWTGEATYPLFMAALVIGARATPLARIQADLVADRLQQFGVETLVRTMSSQGDRSLGGSLAQSKGVFTGELSAALRDGAVDLVVHSLKDLPVDDEPDLVIAAVPERERPFDLLLLAPGVHATGTLPLAELLDVLESSQRVEPRSQGDVEAAAAGGGPACRATPASEAFAALPAGARLGTSSPRRQAGALAVRPDLVCCAVRGSVGRRLEWLHGVAVDALLAAEAGLVRLARNAELEPWAEALRGFRLDLKSWPCAPGQGALAVQVLRGGRLDGHPAMGRLDHPPSRTAVVAERSLLGLIGGGCLRPFGAWADVGASADVRGRQSGQFSLRAVHATAAPDDWRQAAGAGEAPLAVRAATSPAGDAFGVDLDGLGALAARIKRELAQLTPQGSSIDPARRRPRNSPAPSRPARIERGLAARDPGSAAPARSLGSDGSDGSAGSAVSAGRGTCRPPSAAGEQPGSMVRATRRRSREPITQVRGWHARAASVWAPQGQTATSSTGATSRTSSAAAADTPDLIVTSSPTTVRRLTRRLDAAVRVAALPATAVEVLDVTWPADRVDLDRPRRQWPWLLVSSPTAARVVAERAAREPIWGRLPWCALGEGTARTLLAAGAPPNLAARAADGRGLANYAARVLDPRCPLFVPHSARGGRSLVDALEAAGREVVAWTAYTVHPASDLAWPGSWQAGSARVLFTAPSAVAAFAASGMDWPRSCWAIGAATAAALRNAGADNVKCAHEPTAAGIEHLWNEETSGNPSAEESE